MTLPVVFWLVLGGWAFAAGLGLIRLLFDVLAADARGAGFSARLLVPALRTCIRVGVGFTSFFVASAIFETINATWDLGFKPLSYYLTADNWSVKQLVLVPLVWMCCTTAFKFVDMLLDTLLPIG
jgi:hypothetical protein